MSMTLSAFLGITQFLATCLANTYSALDGIVIIDSPLLTVLDFTILIPAVLARLYMFYLFLMNQDDPEVPISSDPGDMFQ